MSREPFEIEHRGAVVVVRVADTSLTSVRAHEITDRLRAEHRATGASRFVIDLARVSMLDSTCIGILIAFLQDLAESGGRVILAGPRPEVRFLFESTGLQEVFGLIEDVDTAVRRLEDADEHETS